MKYVYGPVPSRRLGSSLGIDPIPFKTCNYQCIYCQLGRTNNFTNKRKNYFQKNDIINEIKIALKLNNNNFKYITFVGSGEPTLYKDLEDLILEVKKNSKKPISVITNGALLYNEEVRNALINADVVLPSFDAGNEKLFIQINRPHPSIKYSDVIKGFIDFRKEFKGKLWIEIMIMKGINDSKEVLLEIKKKLNKIKPDRIDINIPIRSPTEDWVNIPDNQVYNLLNNIFGNFKNLNFPEEGEFQIYSSNFEGEVLSIIQRHPMRQEQIFNTFSSQFLNEKDILTRLEKLESKKKIQKKIYNKKIYWKFREDSN